VILFSQGTSPPSDAIEDWWIVFSAASFGRLAALPALRSAKRIGAALRIAGFRHEGSGRWRGVLRLHEKSPGKCVNLSGRL